MITVSIKKSGPFFDGRSEAAVDAFVNEATEEIADHGFNLVHSELEMVLRHPTGYYQSQISTERVTPGHWLLHDNGVIYGPWLEGTSERNRTTRFKGYFTFRKVAQLLKIEAKAIAERILIKYVGRM